MRERELRPTVFASACAQDFPVLGRHPGFIKSKLGGEDVLFRSNSRQRKFAERLEKMRHRRKTARPHPPSRPGNGEGSTCAQLLYMAWLQLVHSKGPNSL